MNRRERRAKAAHDKKAGFKLGRVVDGVVSEIPETVRFSTVVAALRRKGETAKAERLIQEQRDFGSTCPNCGELKDPILGIVGEGENARVAFACPNCSGPELRAAWEREGMRS